jgi:ABC-type nickel/cobalt efflux system permease component RcnA
VTQEAVELRYIIDMAEIPTFQELQETAIVPQEGHPSLEAYLAQRGERLRIGLHLTLNDQLLTLQPVASEIRFPPGVGGLPTLKLAVVYRAVYDADTSGISFRLHYRDDNFPGRAGWKEIIAVADTGMTLEQSAVPATDRSQALTDYPTDLRSSPPQVLEATLLLRQVPQQSTATIAPPLALRANQRATPGRAFAALMTAPQLSLGVVLLALAVAMGLGALHALEPGHGKTVVAAYLVGTRGTARHALYLGLVVTITHTVGVYLLGVVTLYASQYVVPERLYPWLSVLSGLSIAGLGGYLLVRRATSDAQPHDHLPVHPHHHTHHSGPAYHHEHDHQPGEPHVHHAHHHHAIPGETVSWRALLTLGLTGGIVPCPAALVVLLSAVALHRIGFGLLLIAAFSAGLAAVLIAIGLLMVYAHQFMVRFQGTGTLVRRWLPLTSAAVVTLFGVVMTCQTLLGAGLW